VFGWLGSSGCAVCTATVLPVTEEITLGVTPAAVTALGVNPSSTSHLGVGFE
jgi:hypothetical protein